MIQLFKILKGIYDPSCVPHVDLVIGTIIRGYYKDKRQQI